MEKGNQAGSQIAKKRAWDKMAGQKSRILPLGLFFFLLIYSVISAMLFKTVVKQNTMDGNTSNPNNDWARVVEVWVVIALPYFDVSTFFRFSQVGTHHAFYSKDIKNENLDFAGEHPRSVQVLESLRENWPGASSGLGGCPRVRTRTAFVFLDKCFVP